uniref:Uncharacterized protein n=2 Tax=Strongyloides stercoralis TaxID=6248 RepID=A0AAF5DTG1_STRER
NYLKIIQFMKIKYILNKNNNQYMDNITVKIFCYNFYQKQNEKYENFRKKNFSSIGDSPIKYLNDMYIEIGEFSNYLKSFHLSNDEINILNQVNNINTNLTYVLFDCSMIRSCKKLAHLKTLPFFYITRNIFFQNFETNNNYKIDTFNVFIYRMFDEFFISKEELEEKIKAPKFHFIHFMENEITYLFNKLVDYNNDYSLYLPPTKDEEIEVINGSLDNYCMLGYFKKIRKMAIHLHFVRLLLDSKNIDDELYKYEVFYVVNVFKKRVKHLIDEIDKNKCFEDKNQLYDNNKYGTISNFEVEQKIREYRQNKLKNINEYFIINLLLNKTKK